jgi:superfamily II DNA or RNA helicase
MFRAHQDAFGQLCYDLATGQVSGIRSVICSITPGGGKSMLPVIAAKVLLPAVADRIAWVVPRRSLQEQAEAEFATGRSRQLLGHNHLIRKTTGEPDPCRGLSGFVTTYQAIGANNYFLTDEFRDRRYVLILDEPHHVEEGGAWDRALAPLVKRAALTVYMSGTLERGSNKEHIAFLPYIERPEGDVVDLTGRNGCAVIQYSRSDALLDKAILPIHFELLDGTSHWIGRDGKQYSTRLSEAYKDTNDALYTALKTQFGFHLLDECLGHWQSYKMDHPRSKMLVVTANIEDARKYLEHLQEKGIYAEIATSDDSSKAATNINHFKRHGHRAVDVLVTVAMAYEGLDVPAVTHIACLTHIRSKPWIEQMIARATRFDHQAGPWEQQMAFIYVPDDRLMNGIIGRMQHEQFLAVKARLERDEMEELEQLDKPEPGERRSITALGSEGLTRRWSRVGSGHVVETATPALEIRTPSQMEAELRERIQDYCKHVDALFFDRQWGEANKRVVKTFGQSRANMPLDKLQRVMVWLEEYYPVGAMSRK